MNKSKELYIPCPPLDNSSCWDNPHTVFDFWINGIGLTICLVVGLTGNIAAIVFTNKQYGRSRKGPKHMLKGLAIWDISLVVFIWSYDGVQCIFICNTLGEMLQQFFQYTFVASHPFVQTSLTASGLMALLISAQKYLAVCHPMNAGHTGCGWRIVSGAKAVVFASLLALVANIPTFFETRISYCVVTGETRKVKILPTFTWLRENPNYFNWYRMPIRGVLITNGGPFVLTLALSFATVLHAYRAHRVHLTLEERSSQQSAPNLDRGRLSSRSLRVQIQMQSIAAVSALLIIKFLLSHALPCFLDIWEAVSYDSNNEQSRLRFNIVSRISTLLISFNSATNCLVHMRCGRILHRRLRTALRVVSVGRPLFTAREVNLLQESWERILYLTNNKFGEQLILAILSKNPCLAENLVPGEPFPGENQVDRSEAETLEAIRAEGERIDNFFNLLVRSINPLTTAMELKDPIRMVGIVHENNGVIVPVDSYVHMKNWFLQLTNDVPKQSANLCEQTENVHSASNLLHSFETSDSEICQKAWKKLICLMIGEIRQGARNQAHRLSKRRNALFQPSGGSVVSVSVSHV